MDINVGITVAPSVSYRENAETHDLMIDSDIDVRSWAIRNPSIVLFL